MFPLKVHFTLLVSLFSITASALFAQSENGRLYLNNPLRVYSIQLEKTTETELTANYVHERLHAGLLETAPSFNIIYETNRADLPNQLHILQCDAYESDLINKGTEPINPREAYRIYEKNVKLSVSVELKVEANKGKPKTYKKRFQKSGKITIKMLEAKGHMKKEVISEWTWEKAPYQLGKEINQWVASILVKQRK